MYISAFKKSVCRNSFQLRFNSKHLSQKCLQALRAKARNTADGGQSKGGEQEMTERGDGTACVIVSSKLRRVSGAGSEREYKIKVKRGEE